jgi:cell division protein FtsZ
MGVGASPDYAVPSVWRTNRTQAAAKVESLVSNGMEEIEIPAFLRKQAD